MSNYSEKLKDPQWQKKRLEIMDRDNWTCQKCGSTEKTLHVHHQYYIKGHEPWEYCSMLLVTLCYKCHEEEEYAKTQTDEFVEYLLMQPVLRCDIHSLLSHVACAIDEHTNYSSSCKVYRDKINEIIELIDNTYRPNRKRSFKTSQEIDNG